MTTGRQPPRSSTAPTSAPAGCNRSRALLRAPAAVAAALACGLLLGREPARSEAPPAPAPPPELAPLDFLLGEWAGTGTLTFGTREQKFKAALTVRRAVGGAFVVVEETLTTPPSRTAEPAVLQATVMLISWDAETKQFRADLFSDGQPPRHGGGRLQGGVLALQFKPEDEKSPAADLRTFTPGGRRELKSLGEHSKDGLHWGIDLSASYTRSTAP